MDGLRFLAEARERTGLPIVTEVMEPSQVEIVALHADILQVGARNMQNYPLLMAVGRARRPVLLKRGLSATIEEWLMAAEYIVSSGNPEVILCERGIRTFETYTRNTLDLAAVPLLHRLSHLPVIVDPSHATGKRWLVRSMALAAVAAGADGIMVEVHPDPDDALSDGEQSLTLEQFGELAPLLRKVHAEVTGLAAEPRTPPPERGTEGAAIGREWHSAYAAKTMERRWGSRARWRLVHAGYLSARTRLPAPCSAAGRLALLASALPARQPPHRPRSPRTYGRPNAAGAPMRFRLASRAAMMRTRMTRAKGSMFRKNVEGW